MSKPYDSKVFWESRLRRSFNLKGVGHIGFSEWPPAAIARLHAAAVKTLSSMVTA